MFRNPQQMRQRLNELVEKFRAKGATSPEKAMTIQELGLPPRFEQAMHRRLGQTGIFVEVSGKYYLNEERLRQIQQQRASGGAGGYGNRQAGPPSWMRYAGIMLMLPIGIIIVVILYFFVFYSGAAPYPGEFLIIILVVLLIVFVARMLLWRSRRRYWGQNSSQF